MKPIAFQRTSISIAGSAKDWDIEDQDAIIISEMMG